MKNKTKSHRKLTVSDSVTDLSSILSYLRVKHYKITFVTCGFQNLTGIA